MLTVAQLSHYPDVYCSTVKPPQRLAVAQLSYSPDVHCRTAEPPPDAHFGNLRHPQISIPFYKSVLSLFYVCLSVFVCKWYKYVHTQGILNGWRAENCLQESTYFLSFSPMGREPRGLNPSHQAWGQDFYPLSHHASFSFLTHDAKSFHSTTKSARPLLA